MRLCACKPCCLTWLRPGDQVVATPAGDVLAEHVAVQPYPEALDTNDALQILEAAS